MRAKPKKRLGQNFLFDRNVLKKISAAADLQATDVVLEIGSGRGELTSQIAPKVSAVLAVEIDPELSSELAENLKKHPNVRVIEADILKVNLAKLAPAAAKLKVIGNIPYYISTPIIARLFKYRRVISAAYITVQKEFAERVTAEAGSDDYGSLSCFAQFYARPKRVFNISKNCFFPRPKVDSALLELDFSHKNALPHGVKKRLFQIIRSGFNKRRKTLRNSLSGVVSRGELEAFFKRYSLDADIRPEELALSDFINLAKIIK